MDSVKFRFENEQYNNVWQIHHTAGEILMFSIHCCFHVFHIESWALRMILTLRSTFGRPLHKIYPVEFSCQQKNHNNWGPAINI